MQGCPPAQWPLAMYGKSLIFFFFFFWIQSAHCTTRGCLHNFRSVCGFPSKLGSHGAAGPAGQPCEQQPHASS